MGMPMGGPMGVNGMAPISEWQRAQNWKMFGILSTTFLGLATVFNGVGWALQKSPRKLRK